MVNKACQTTNGLTKLPVKIPTTSAKAPLDRFGSMARSSLPNVRRLTTGSWMWRGLAYEIGGRSETSLRSVFLLTNVTLWFRAGGSFAGGVLCHIHWTLHCECPFRPLHRHLSCSLSTGISNVMLFSIDSNVTEFFFLLSLVGFVDFFLYPF